MNIHVYEDDGSSHEGVGAVKVSTYLYIIHKYTYYIPTLYKRHDDEDRGAALAQYPISSAAARPLLSSIIIIRMEVYIYRYMYMRAQIIGGYIHSRWISRGNLPQCPSALFQSLGLAEGPRKVQVRLG